jgi:hypothetical protein
VGCIEVVEAERRREEGSTSGRARSELACGGREGARAATARRAGRKAGQRASAGESKGGNGQSATVGESDCKAAGGAGEVRVRGERVK